MRIAHHPFRAERELLRMLEAKMKVYPTLEEGWDGYDAEPLIPGSLDDAKKFLAHRPKGVKVPFMEINTTGEIGLYWEEGRVFAMITFEGNGKFYYYAGCRTPSGKDIWARAESCDANSCWPAGLLMVVREVGRAEARRMKGVTISDSGDPDFPKLWFYAMVRMKGDRIGDFYPPAMMPEPLDGFIRSVGNSPQTEQELLEELEAKMREYPTLEERWDGYDAEPLIPESLGDARKFLAHRPKEAKVPFVGLNPTGEVELYWEEKRVFAHIVFEGNGKFYYYAVCRTLSGKDIWNDAEDCDADSCWPVGLLEVVRVIDETAPRRDR